MSEQAPHRRRSAGGQYPLWLGVLALGGFTALWLGARQAPPPEPTADADPGPPDAAAAPAAPDAPPRIEWRIGPRGPMDPGVLDECLARAGHDRALVVGDDPMLITYPGKLRPTTITPADLDDAPALALSTPVEGDARLAASLHVSTAACLYVEGAAVHDAALDRQATGRNWPQLGEGGGLPVDHLIAIEQVPGGLITRGLTRLGRPELGLAVPPGHDPITAHRFIRAYAAAAVVAPAGADRLDRGGGFFARPLDPATARAAGWWTAPETATRLSVLATADADRPLPVALPPAQPHRAPPRPERRRPKQAPPPPRPPAKAPAPTKAPAAPSKKPVPFNPAYR